MTKDWILLLGSGLMTVLLALGVIRWLAPELLGIHTDLQLVKVNETLPPFFDGVFRDKESKSTNFLLKDPITGIRARPLFKEQNGMGPNDLLGFRNKSVPNSADLIIFGDSQTYGNNASIEENWPHQLNAIIGTDVSTTYTMAVGGWGAVQYLYMAKNALLFQPRQIVVAFYSGNDPLESFRMVYGNELWKDLIPDERLKQSDLPSVAFPAPESERWRVSFSDGVATVFTPKLRLASNFDHPAANAGWMIMENSARRIREITEQLNIELLFTVIPTKELVYSQKILQENIDAPPDYARLIQKESQNIRSFANAVNAIENTRYIDVVGPLQRAALKPLMLYSVGPDGHPIASGYEVIAKAVRPYVAGNPPE